MNWIYTFVSAAGTSHIRSGNPCQDSCTCEVIKSKDNDEVLIAIASDGAGSAKCSETGSRLICNIVKHEIIDFLKRGSGLKDITRETAEGWIEKFRQEILYIAGDNGRTARDYACTLVGAIVGLHEEVYFQIGDGAIAVLPRYCSREYKCIFWPRRGEYENTTYFATEKDAAEQLQFKTGEADEDEIANIAVFTDGIQHLALHYESRTPFEGFFKPLFRALNSLNKRDTEEINALFGAFLCSEKIVSRTDDDKTLIIAARV